MVHSLPLAGPLMAKDRDAQLRNLIAGYGDSIRLSDIKANIAVLFVAIMMGTVLGFRDNYPSYLNVPVLLAPFIVIFFCLLASVYPRFPREGRRRFPLWRNSYAGGFRVHHRSGARSGGLALSLRAPLQAALLEDRHAPGRLPLFDGDDRGGGGADVRDLAMTSIGSAQRHG